MRVCILHSHDHRRHLIIRRKIDSFLKAGIDLAVVDQAAESAARNDPSYRHILVRKMRWTWFIRIVWPVIRRLRSQDLADRFWRFVLRLRIWSNATRLALAAVGERADVYIAEDLQAALAALIASRFRQRPIIYDAHEVESEQGHGEEVRVQRAFLWAMEARLLPRVDRLVVPNRTRGALYEERYGLKQEPLVVLNCAPETAAPVSNRLREVLELPDTVRIVLYHGALIPHRALDYLIRSAAYFSEGTALVVIGEQSSYYRDVLEPLWRAEGLSDRVFFLPYIDHDDLSPYVASADLGIVIYENVNLNNYLCAPMKLYEYIMMRVPVAVCNFPELVGFLERHPVGKAFDPDDPRSIAAAVNSFLKDREAGRVARAALDEARQRYSWERESLKWLALLGPLGN